MKANTIFATMLLACALASATADSVHPVAKIIDMLKGLKATSVAEGEKDEITYSKFDFWCKSSLSEINDALDEEAESIEELTDTIAGLEKQDTSLGTDINGLSQKILEKQQSAAASKAQNDKDTKLFKQTDKDLTGTIAGVDAALKAVSGAGSKTEAMMMLAQLDATGKPGADVAKHVDKYDFKSEKVVELLKNLKTEAKQDQQKARITQTNTANQYAVSTAARTSAIKALEKSKGENKGDLASTKSSEAKNAATLKSTQADQAADSKRKKTVTEKCRIGKIEFEERAKTRSLEITAMDTAVEILGKATGLRTKAPGNPLPPSNPMDFFQLAQTVQSDSNPRMKAVALLRQAATDAHSHALERLAVAVAAHLNAPFDKVNAMVQKMIFRLQEEQTAEDEHKLWCDKEVEKTNVMDDDNVDEQKKLAVAIKSEKGAIAKLTAAIEDANEVISDITKFMKDATEIRLVGKEENRLAIKDSQDAQKAIANAVSVLTAFYKSTGAVKKEAWEFVQEDADAPVKLAKDPALWDSPYTGVGDKKKQPAGILNVLQTVNADFVKMEGDTKAQETIDQKEYEKDMQENKIEKARRAQEVEMKDAERKSRSEKTNELVSNKKATDIEVEKTKQYLKDLIPACGTGEKKDHADYAKRKANRDKEIKALHKAQGILGKANKGASFLQRRN